MNRSKIDMLKRLTNSTGFVFAGMLLLSSDVGLCQPSGEVDPEQSPARKSRPTVVMFSYGVVFPGRVSLDEPGVTITPYPSYSLGAGYDVGLGSGLFLGPYIDYHLMRTVSSLFIWGGEFAGDISMKLWSLRLQPGIGVGYSIIHRKNQSFDDGVAVRKLQVRLVSRVPRKIGWMLEGTRYFPGNLYGSLREGFSALRVGVVF